LNSGSQTVIKSPYLEEDEAAIEIERDIYERFTQQGGHEGLLQYFGPFETGIRLEFAQNHGLLPYIRKHESDIRVNEEHTYIRVQYCTNVLDGQRNQCDKPRTPFDSEGPIIGLLHWSQKRAPL